MKPLHTLLPLLAALAAPLGAFAAAPAPQEIRLWPGKAPGTENWTVPESVTTSPGGERTVSNVSDPTLTVFLPDPAIATGTAVVLAPGGAMRVLGIDGNGTQVAKWLNDKGIAAFVLKYRTVQQAPGARGAGPGGAPRAGGPGAGPGAPRAGGPGGAGAPPPRQEMEIRNANANPEPGDAALAEAVQMAIADGQAALRLIRKNAKEWKVDPARVGIMGFSAGGGVAVGTALAQKSDAYPDFLMTMYGPSLVDVNVPAHAPPLFIAVGATHFNVTNGCLALFAAWKAAGKPAEIHVYDGVSAGFSLAKRGLPVDGWIDRAYEWLVARKLTDPR
ncbi:MAG TPA: alpha/beta hydrolase [Steroidobacteraceae bacterium]|nr:alpha/beta hydrolase [Steroidobacteraceae bacterium]